MLTELKSDRLYITMCRNQKCFRARLTPKPFRLRCGTPPGHYPYPDDTAAKQFEAWKAIYDQQSKDVATCQFIDTVGSGRVDSKISKLVELHDRYAKAGSNLPLA